MFFLIPLVILLSGCGDHYAPVRDGTASTVSMPVEAVSSVSVATLAPVPSFAESAAVEAAETEASIHPEETAATSSEIATEPEPKPAASLAVGKLSSATWMWPAKGPVVREFSRKNKGIDIQGNLGDPVYATAAGEVVYSGTGLRGYGQLIIIKHNADYLSAYAHNSRVLVKEGDTLTQGQQIAEMGDTGTDSVKLHFELRHQGKPVDPLQYLPK